MTNREKQRLDKSKQVGTVVAVLFTFFLFMAIVVIAQGKTVRVEASVLNVRTGPGLSYDIMTQVRENDELKVIDEKNEWYKVRLAGDQIGWVASWLVKNTEVSSGTNQVGTIISSTANIRKEATTSSDILGTVSKGTEVTVLFSQNNWVQINYQGQIAWVSGELIEVSAEKGSPSNNTGETNAPGASSVTILKDGTNIRSGPSTDDASLLKASSGDTYTVLETENDWHKITLSDGTTGYVANWVVTLSDGAAPTSTEASPPLLKPTSLAEATVVIDAGHGGKDSGANSNGLLEKELTLSTAKILAKKLEAFGTNVILTRSDDQTLSLNDRVYIAHTSKADAFISLHYDAYKVDNGGSGTSTFYYSDADRGLAESIHKAIGTKGPLRNNGVKRGDYLVLHENLQPSVLLELGFINNTVDATYIQRETYQALMADQIIHAMTEYFTN